MATGGGNGDLGMRIAELVRQAAARARSTWRKTVSEAGRAGSRRKARSEAESRAAFSARRACRFTAYLSLCAWIPASAGMTEQGAGMTEQEAPLAQKRQALAPSLAAHHRLQHLLGLSELFE